MGKLTEEGVLSSAEKNIYTIKKNKEFESPLNDAKEEMDAQEIPDTKTYKNTVVDYLYMKAFYLALPMESVTVAKLQTKLDEEANQTTVRKLFDKMAQDWFLKIIQQNVSIRSVQTMRKKWELRKTSVTASSEEDWVPEPGQCINIQYCGYGDDIIDYTHPANNPQPPSDDGFDAEAYSDDDKNSDDNDDGVSVAIYYAQRNTLVTNIETVVYGIYPRSIEGLQEQGNSLVSGIATVTWSGHDGVERSIHAFRGHFEQFSPVEVYAFPNDRDFVVGGYYTAKIQVADSESTITISEMASYSQLKDYIGSIFPDIPIDSFQWISKRGPQVHRDITDIEVHRWCCFIPAVALLRA